MMKNRIFKFFSGNKYCFIAFAYLFAIFMTIWSIFWGLPLIAGLFDNYWWKFLSLFFYFPLIPMFPGLFTGAYKLKKIPVIYLYEFFDMYLAVFFIIIIIPSMFVSVFTIIGSIIVVSCILILFIWIFKFSTGLSFAGGLRFDDFIVYVTILNIGIMLILGARLLYYFLEKISFDVQDEAESRVTQLFKYLEKRKKKRKEIYR